MPEGRPELPGLWRGVCHPPDVVRLELPVKEIALVDRSLHNAKS